MKSYLIENFYEDKYVLSAESEKKAKEKFWEEYNTEVRKIKALTVSELSDMVSDETIIYL